MFLFSFDFCSAGEENAPSENLGQVVFGERIRASPYKVSILIWQHIEHSETRWHNKGFYLWWQVLQNLCLRFDCVHLRKPNPRNIG